VVIGVLVLAALTGCSGSSAPAPSPSPEPSPSASPSPSPSPLPPSPSPSPSPPPSPTHVASAPRLTGDGIDLATGVVLFGTTVEKAAPALQKALGKPTKDTGIVSSFSDYGTCPGTKLRALEYGGGALVVLFGNVKGSALTMYQWALQPKGTTASVPKASAFIGDVTTYEFGIGTTLGKLRAGVGQDRLTVTAGGDSQAPSFTVKDQSSGIFGQLSGTTNADDTIYIQAGQRCGE
jgi:hypothetical protein